MRRAIFPLVTGAQHLHFFVKCMCILIFRGLYSSSANPSPRSMRSSGSRHSHCRSSSNEGDSKRRRHRSRRGSDNESEVSKSSRGSRTSKCSKGSSGGCRHRWESTTVFFYCLAVFSNYPAALVMHIATACFVKFFVSWLILWSFIRVPTYHRTEVFLFCHCCVLDNDHTANSITVAIIWRIGDMPINDD